MAGEGRYGNAPHPDDPERPFRDARLSALMNPGPLTYSTPAQQPQQAIGPTPEQVALQHQLDQQRAQIAAMQQGQIDAANARNAELMALLAQGQRMPSPPPTAPSPAPNVIPAGPTVSWYSTDMTQRMPTNDVLSRPMRISDLDAGGQPNIAGLTREQGTPRNNPMSLGPVQLGISQLPRQLTLGQQVHATLPVNPSILTKRALLANRAGIPLNTPGSLGRQRGGLSGLRGEISQRPGQLTPRQPAQMLSEPLRGYTRNYHELQSRNTANDSKTKSGDLLALEDVFSRVLSALSTDTIPYVAFHNRIMFDIFDPEQVIVRTLLGLIQDLDSDRFIDRENATAALVLLKTIVKNSARNLIWMRNLLLAFLDRTDRSKQPELATRLEAIIDFFNSNIIDIEKRENQSYISGYESTVSMFDELIAIWVRNNMRDSYPPFGIFPDAEINPHRYELEELKRRRQQVKKRLSGNDIADDVREQLMKELGELDGEIEATEKVIDFMSAGNPI